MSSHGGAEGRELSRVLKTLVCVAIAGALFITAILYDVRWLFVVAAFFDWLPLFTKWMKIGTPLAREARAAVTLHAVVTVVAYIAGIAWLLIGSVGVVDLGYIFLLLWFQAVVLGAYTTAVQLLAPTQAKR